MSFYSGTERIEALEAKVDTLELRTTIMQDERLSFFSKAMPGSIGRHSEASRIINNTYGRRCLFCDETNDVSNAHIVAGNTDVNYSAFCKPKYKDNLEVKSARNFLPLCGAEGKDGTCHNEFDKYLMTLLYQPFEGVYRVYCLRKTFPKYSICHDRVVNVDMTIPPYCRLLAWRTRKCIMEHQSLIPRDVDNLIRLSNFSERSHSVANDVAEDDDEEDYEAESHSKQSGI